MGTGDFIVRLYDDASNAPGLIIKEYISPAVNRSPTSLVDVVGSTVYQYDFTLPSAVALSSSVYYLSVMNETQNSSWYWLAGTGNDASNGSRVAGGDAWTKNTNGDLALGVNGTIVPTPSALILIISGLAPIAVGFRINRRRHSDTNSTLSI